MPEPRAQVQCGRCGSAHCAPRVTSLCRAGGCRSPPRVRRPGSRPTWPEPGPSVPTWGTAQEPGILPFSAARVRWPLDSVGQMLFSCQQKQECKRSHPASPRRQAFRGNFWGKKWNFASLRPPVNSLGSPAVCGRQLLSGAPLKSGCFPQSTPPADSGDPSDVGPDGEASVACPASARPPPRHPVPSCAQASLALVPGLGVVSSARDLPVTHEAGWGPSFWDTWSAAARLGPRRGWRRAHAEHTPCTSRPGEGHGSRSDGELWMGPLRVLRRTHSCRLGRDSITPCFYLAFLMCGLVM